MFDLGNLSVIVHKLFYHHVQNRLSYLTGQMKVDTTLKCSVSQDWPKIFN